MTPPDLEGIRDLIFELRTDGRTGYHFDGKHAAELVDTLDALLAEVRRLQPYEHPTWLKCDVETALDAIGDIKALVEESGYPHEWRAVEKIEAILRALVVDNREPWSVADVLDALPAMAELEARRSQTPEYREALAKFEEARDKLAKQFGIK